jgi:signal transduction histidine kinase
MRSLALKLTLAFLVVGLTGAVLVAIFVGRLTRQEFDEFVIDRYQTDLLTDATDYYAANGTWAGVESALNGRRGPGQGYGNGGGEGAISNGKMQPPIAIVDNDGNVVFDNLPDELSGSGNIATGNSDLTALPVEIDGTEVGTIYFVDRPGAGNVRETPEANFLAGVDRAILWSAVAAAGLALLLGVILARTISRPVQELTAATKVLAGGDLGHQVPVRTGDEIGQLAQSFNQMSADLAHSNQLRRQMTADIAHDLRTPLSVILGYSEALADGKLPGMPETYTAMHVQAQHLNRLIEDLRTLSLADAGQLSLMRRPVDPQGLLEHTALAYLPAAESRGISISVEGEAVKPVSVDPDRMLQVLGNLVGNALRHTPDGGRVILSAARANGHLLLRVQDNGPGIPAEDLPHIFDRFYRGDTARQSDGASGLGLAIARSLIEAHDGRIAVENAPGGGALFTISIPTTDPTHTIDPA